MSKRRKIEPEQARRLKEYGLTHAEIAEISGLTVSGVQQLLASVGCVKKYRSHKEAIPWRLQTDHSNSTVATYLRRLSMLSQGRRIQSGERAHNYSAKAVMDWANAILEKGLDVDYARDVPPSDFNLAGGFFLRPADPGNWHLKALMDRVVAAQAAQAVQAAEAAHAAHAAQSAHAAHAARSAQAAHAAQSAQPAQSASARSVRPEQAPAETVV